MCSDTILVAVLAIRRLKGGLISYYQLSYIEIHVQELISNAYLGMCVCIQTYYVYM